MDNDGHTTRYSDSSLYDEICTKCGATDAQGSDGLDHKCPQNEDASGSTVAPGYDTIPDYRHEALADIYLYIIRVEDSDKERAQDILRIANKLNDVLNAE